ncbi:extracellular solute-binding protein [Arthrobacter sp. AET 35A]|uniref:extracellular solute-binding protein n=1 Tax=Arthrobacter sp. AET 35A TaxID=2292643 RepID=UPI0017872942|nr:extracellular solute-binding protein [Arthrobacter sp. AET 35A]MBE0011081.1 extracellular solute-binding protein [Arthrobacter sp. AET 35A]
MRQVTRTVRALSVFGVTTLLLTGCATGTGSQDGPAAEFDADSAITGELSVMGFGVNDEIAESRFESAQAELPDVDITLVEGDLDIQQFLSAVASGEPPELIYANRDQLGTFASRGAIMPLNDCLDAEAIDTTNFREPAMNQVTFEDQVYGVPEFNQVQVTMANAGLLEDADLSLDDVDGSDWNGVTEAAEKVFTTDSGRISVIGYDPKLPEFLPIWARANGADLLSADARTAQLNDPAVVQALEFAAGLYEIQDGFSAVKAYRDSADFFGSGNQFASSTLGAMPMEQWYINILNDVSPDAEMAFTTVKDTSGEDLSFSSGSAWAIPAASSNPEAACRFIGHMTDAETWVAAAGVRAEARQAEGKPFTGLFTGNQTADDQIREQFVKPSDDAKWDEAIDASYAANESSFSLPANPADAEFKTAWQDGVNRVLNGQQDPQEAMDQAQEEAQTALDEAWSTWDDE